MEIDLSAQIERFYESMRAAIEAMPDQIDSDDYQPDTAEAEAVAVEANTEARELVLAGYQELVNDATDADAQDIEPVSAAAIAFFAAKVLRDAAQSIRSAQVARQIFDDERDEAIQRAVDSALSAAENVAESELYASAALYDEATGQENGFRYYEYVTSGDRVVRPAHRRRNRKLFRYGSQRTPDDVPGLTSRCRCFAFPLSDEEAQARTADFFYPQDAPGPSADAGKKPFRFRPTALGLNGDIGCWWDMTSFEQFREMVEAERASGAVSIDSTSHGGLLDDGMAMYSYLKSIPEPVTFNVYGHCGSAATLPMCAANHVTADAADRILIHHATGGYIGKVEGFDSARDELMDANAAMVEAYKYKTGRSEQEIIELMNEDRYISAQRALEFGLIDEIRGKNSPKAKPVAPSATNPKEKFFMPTQEEFDALQAKFDDLKAETDQKLSDQGEQIATLKAENAALEKKANIDVDALVDERIADKAKAQSELEAEKKRLDDLGITASGSTVEELQRSAVLALDIGGEQFTPEECRAALTAYAKVAAPSDGRSLGRGLMGGGNDDRKPETRKERAARLRKEQANG